MWIKRRALCPWPCVPWGAFGSDTLQRVGLWYCFGSSGPLSCHFSGFNLRAVCRRVLGPSTEKVLSSGAVFLCSPCVCCGVLYCFLVSVPYFGRVWQNLSLLAVSCPYALIAVKICSLNYHKYNIYYTLFRSLSRSFFALVFIPILIFRCSTGLLGDSFGVLAMVYTNYYTLFCFLALVACWALRYDDIILLPIILYPV